MAGIPSIGDLLMLSQLAWKIGRAFTKGRKGAPHEFLEVEAEAKGLTTALKLVAECLLADRNNLLSHAGEQTTHGVATILNSCEHTLKDLESLLQQYQAVRTYRTEAGTTTEVGWSDLVLQNYKIMMWTTEGGSIQELRNMLNMHTQTITIMLQALQSKSLARLEATVAPMAEKIDEIHNAVTGELGGKIDEVHRVVMALAGGVAVPKPRQIQREIEESLIDLDDRNSRLLEPAPPRIGILEHANSTHRRAIEERKRLSSIISPTHDILNELVGSDASSSNSSLRRVSQITASSHSSGNRRESHSSECLPNPPPIGSPSSFVTQPGTARSSGGSYFHSPPSHMLDSPILDRDGNSTHGSQSNGHGYFQQQPQHHQSLPYHSHPSQQPSPYAHASYPPGTSQQPMANTPPPSIPPRSPHRQNSLRWTPWRPTTPGSANASVQMSPPSPFRMPSLPPPALPSDADIPTSMTRKSSILAANAPEPLSPGMSIHGGTTIGEYDEDDRRFDGHEKEVSADEQEVFERQLFRNSAILCDLRGAMVEYASPVGDDVGGRFDVEMVKPMEDCRICVVRRRENLPNGKIRLTMAIYAFGDDRTVRMQQRLHDTDNLIPYPSFFSPEKISISVPTELRFLDIPYGSPPLKTVQTSWVNYIFADGLSSTQFQNVLYGRNLLHSYKTEKTLRLHEGFSGAFTYQEQMCAMEMLRIWEDEATNGILAMIHFSAHFRPGYMIFWLNDSTYAVRAKDDGGKFIKIKGLRIPLIKGTNNTVQRTSIVEKEREKDTVSISPTDEKSKDAKKDARRGSDGKKYITGARVEFASETEKIQFLGMLKEVQKTMIPLPELN